MPLADRGTSSSCKEQEWLRPITELCIYIQNPLLKVAEICRVNMTHTMSCLVLEVERTPFQLINQYLCAFNTCYTSFWYLSLI